MPQALYPFSQDLLSKDLREISNEFSNGNFGLWFNKFIPVDDEKFKVSNSGGRDTEAIPFYRNQFNDMASGNSLLNEMLNKKHLNQIRYGKVVSEQYVTLVLQAELVTPLIVGLGGAHPAETALVLDHTLGIPYIPASSVKGVVRFAYSLGLLEDEDGNFSDRYVIQENINEGILDEANPDTQISQMFGGDRREADTEEICKRRGGIVFLDAYPAEIPKIRADVMTPHYPDYYSDREEEVENPPADNQNPNPIQFLCVQQGTVFVFRMLVEKDLWESVQTGLLGALKKAVIDEGVGAKTAAGYGRFEVRSDQEPDDFLDQYREWLMGPESPLSREEKRKLRLKEFMNRVVELEKGDQSGIDELFNEWRKNDDLRESVEIAELFAKVVKKKKASGDRTKQYAIVCELIGKEDGTRDDATDEEKRGKATVSRQLSSKEQAIVSKMKKFVEKGSITKKELKKMKAHKNLAPEVFEQLQNLPRD